MNNERLHKVRTRPQLALISMLVIGCLAMFLFFPGWISKLAFLYMAANGAYFIREEWKKP